MNRPVSGLKVLALTFALLSLLALITGVAFGQAISGNFVGNVVDSSGAVVANADVEAVNVGTGATFTSKTSSTGEYRFENLLGGEYRLTAKASGFRTVTQSVTVLLNQTRTINITLPPGSASETVEVSGSATAIDTTTQNIQNTFEEKTLQDLPTASTGLGVLNLSLLNAGVASAGGIGVGTGPSVSGQRPRNNNFTVEGVDNNSKAVTGLSLSFLTMQLRILRSCKINFPQSSDTLQADSSIRRSAAEAIRFMEGLMSISAIGI